MGITGLLPFLKKASQRANLKDFKGQTAAVDVYCWLHKGAFSCADKLAKGEKTNGYVIYVMKQVSLLLSHGIRPIMVFDGCNLPSKAVTDTKRREKRAQSRKQAKELLRQGRVSEAREHFQRCVEVTSEMAFEVISACRARNIDVIVAPYEADAQLAFLNLSGLAQVVITEDSDLVVYGCKATLFKLDGNGGCVYVDQEKLHLAMNIPRDKFSFEKFRNITILSGCDYLPSLSGIGLVKACKFFNVTANTDVFNALCKLPSYLNMPNLEVTQEYRKKFMQAINTFLYQLVFDPVTQTLRPLQDYPQDMGPEDYPYAGKFVGHERARQIALGNVNVQSGEVVDYFDPETYKPPAPKSSSWDRKENTACTLPSIWKKGPFKKKVEAPTFINPGRPITKGKEVTVAIPSFFKPKHKLEPIEDDISEEDLKNFYFQPQKRKKVEASPEPLVECKVESNSEENIEEFSNTESQTTNPTLASPKNDEECDDKNIEEFSNRECLTVVSPKDVEKCVDKTMDSATPREASKPRNPFAKMNIKPKNALPTNNFGGVKKFSIMRKPVTDSNVIVQSRFFSPSVQTASSNSEPVVPSKDDEADSESMNVSSSEKDYNAGVEELKSLQNTPRNRNNSLSPVIKSKTSPNNAFNWKRFSNTSFSKSKMQRSASASSTFKTVIPKDKQQLPIQEQSEDEDNVFPSKENNMSQEDKLEEIDSRVFTLSQTSLCSDVDSLDNESFGLTPSLPSSLENSAVIPLKDATNSPPVSSKSKGAQGSVFIGKSQCRTPGMLKTNYKKKDAGKKQLSLIDMFSYKRDKQKLTPAS